MTFTMHRRARRRGFTLIELIVVIIIIAVLAAVAAVAYNQYAAKARGNAVLASASDLRTAVMAAAARDDHTAADEAALLWDQAGGDSAAFLSALSANYAGNVTFAAATGDTAATLLVTSTGSGNHAACLTLTEPPAVHAGGCGTAAAGGPTGGTAPPAAPTDLTVTQSIARGGSATAASGVAWPEGVSFDQAGNMYVTAYNGGYVVKITPSGVQSTIASGLSSPTDTVIDTAGNVYIAERGRNDILKATPGAGGAYTTATFTTSLPVSQPESLSLDAAGDMYVADYGNHRVVKVAPDGTATVVAGGGSSLGDGGPATSASVIPTDVVSDAAGNLYIADWGNNRVRKVDTSGRITTIAGTGAVGYSGDNGPAVSATFNQVHDVAVDPAGDVYVADYNNGAVREIAPDGTIGTLLSGLGRTSDVWFGTDGNLYVTDYDAGVVRKVGTGAVTLTWTAVPDATSYVLYRNGEKVGTATSAGFTDLNAPAGATYTVTAVGPGGESAPSSAATLTP